MSSEIPKKPSGGGNNVFIAMTIVMLLATGGLILWRFTGSSANEPVIASTASPSEFDRPGENLLPPPPPPPPEQPSAAPSAEAPTNAPVRSGKSVCPKICEGEVTAALKSALAGRGGAGRRCYEKSLSQNAMLRGRMTVHVRVGTNGSVCGANVANDELHDPGLSNCIIGVFRSSMLPEPVKGCVDVDVPLNFVPNK